MCSIHIKNYLKPLCVSLKNIVVLQLLSLVQLFVSPWTAVRYASVSFTVSQSLIKFMSIESVMPSNHLILCHPLLFQPSIFPSIRVFSSESALCIKWPKYWSFSFSISPSNEYLGLISFQSDWLDLLAVQGTLKSLLQHHSSKASILQHSAFCVVQLSHPYMTTGKTIILIIQNLVGKVMSLLFNTMFLPLLLSVSVLVLQTCLLPCSQYLLLGLWISPLLLPLLLLPTLLLLRKLTVYDYDWEKLWNY